MKQLQEKIMRLLHSEEIEGDDAAKGDGGKQKHRGFPAIGQLLRIGKDGKLDALEGLNGLAPLLRGEIMIEGPDGQQRIKMKGDADSISKQLKEAMKNSGVEIDVDVAGDVADEIKRAVGRLQRDLPGIRGRVQDRLRVPSNAGEDEQFESISEKLDMILEKIEKLEQDVSKLQKRKKS